MGATKIASGAGLRHVRVWKLDADGNPSDTQSGSDGYSGKRVQGVKTFQANVPDVQPIRHTGDDVVFAQDHLPPTELETATITTGKTNLDLDADLVGLTVDSLGDLQILGYGTDRQGFENQVMVYGWRQSLDTDEDSGTLGIKRQYITHFYPSARMTPKGGQMSEGATDENGYNVTPTPVERYPFGLLLNQGTDGYQRAIKFVVHSENPLMLERFDAPGGVAVFLLDFAPITAAKTKVYVDSGSGFVAATVSSVDVNAKTLTLSAPPSAASVVIAIYETNELT